MMRCKTEATSTINWNQLKQIVRKLLALLSWIKVEVYIFLFQDARLDMEGYNIHRKIIRAEEILEETVITCHFENLLWSAGVLPRSYSLLTYIPSIQCLHIPSWWWPLAIETQKAIYLFWWNYSCQLWHSNAVDYYIKYTGYFFLTWHLKKKTCIFLCLVQVQATYTLISVNSECIFPIPNVPCQSQWFSEM